MRHACPGNPRTEHKRTAHINQPVKECAHEKKTKPPALTGDLGARPMTALQSSMGTLLELILKTERAGHQRKEKWRRLG